VSRQLKRTKAQRRWRRKGYTHEMIPLRRPKPGQQRYSYLVRASENRRAGRELAEIMGMSYRPICKQFIHNGRKP
jgi:hypothetical protein